MSRRRGIFVAGTDTGVGKTVVTAALLSVLRSGGTDAVPMKPVQTGCVADAADPAGGRAGLRAPDLEFCLAACGLSVDAEARALMAPYRFRKPCSPHLAARDVGESVVLPTILKAFYALAGRHSLVCMEGAGGLLVPLNETELMLDLIVATALPVLLVARPTLGTINHTLLSLRELRRACVPVLGVVFNDAAPAVRDEIARDNRCTVERLGQVDLLGHLPFLGALDAGAVDAQAFAAACAPHLPPAPELIRRLDAACP